MKINIINSTDIVNGARIADKTPRPKFSFRGGRAWDTMFGNVVLPNGDKVRATLDYSWGKRGYFEVNNQWYSFPLSEK